MSKAFERFVDQVVTVTKGQHAGRTGYCDDIDDGQAVVYFGTFFDGYFAIRTSALKLADDIAKKRYTSKFMSSPQRWYSKSA